MTTTNTLAQQRPFSKALTAVAWVPGLPQIHLSPDKSTAWETLRGATRDLGRHIESLGTKRIVYFSTQWISVLGQSFQAKANLTGLHVDENWHDMGDLPFQFKVDTPFAGKMAQAAKEIGCSTQLVDFEGFPVDTGTIVADALLNRKGLPTGMVSCHVYADYAATRKLFAALRGAIEADGTPTAVVAVSSITTNYFTTNIDPREDHIRDQNDQIWMDKLLKSFEGGSMTLTDSIVRDMGAAVKTDMGLKAYAVVGGVIGDAAMRPATVVASGAIHGTGNAVVAF